MKRIICWMTLLMYFGFNAYSVDCNFKVYNVNYTGDTLYINVDNESWSHNQITSWDYKIYIEGKDLFIRSKNVSLDTTNFVYNAGTTLVVFNADSIVCSVASMDSNPMKIDTISFPWNSVDYGVFVAFRGGGTADKMHHGWIKIAHHPDNTFTLFQYGFSLNPNSSIMTGRDECNPCSKGVITNNASSIGIYTATLNGFVASETVVNNITFEYGTTISYGSTVAGIPSSGGLNARITANINGLLPNTTYHYRINGNSGSVHGSDKTFTTLDKTSQTIWFSSLTAKTYGDSDFDPGASASSGLQITYSSGNTSVATIVDGKVHIIGAGSSTIYADQAGDLTYYPAPQEHQLLTVNAKVLSVTNASATDKIYDGVTTAAITGATLNGVIGSDAVTLANSASGTFASANVGNGISVTTAMTLTGAAAGNYAITQPVITANITAKALTVISAAAANKVYDGTTTAIISGATLNGVAGTDAVTLSNSTFGAFASANVNTGTSVTTAMTLTGSDAGNYTISQPALTANITPKNLTVSASNKSKTYGEANPSLTFTYDGFISGENTTSLTTEPTAITTAVQYSNVGTYDIVPAGGAASNYAFVYVNGILTINKAPLDITANNVNRKKGEANPAFTFSYTGFKGADDVSIIDIMPTASCSADASSEIGDYDIMVSGGSDNNYTLVPHPGKLTVTPASATDNLHSVAINVYPNPATDYIYISNLPEKTWVRIYNLQGKLLNNIISTKSQEKLNMVDLPLGVYIIKLSGNTTETTIRMVKLHTK